MIDANNMWWWWWVTLQGHKVFCCFNIKKFIWPSSVIFLFFPGLVYFEDFLLQGEAVCVRVCMKVEVTSLLTSFAPRGSHIVQEDADTQADGWPFRLFPWVHIYSGNRNSPPGRGWRKTRSPLLLRTHFLQDPGHDEEAGSSAALAGALRRGGVNL